MSEYRSSGRLKGQRHVVRDDHLRPFRMADPVTYLRRGHGSASARWGGTWRREGVTSGKTIRGYKRGGDDNGCWGFNVPFTKAHIPLQTGFALVTQRECNVHKQYEMYMPNARILRLGPNSTYIPLTCVGVLCWGKRKF